MEVPSTPTIQKNIDRLEQDIAGSSLTLPDLRNITNPVYLLTFGIVATVLLFYRPNFIREKSSDDDGNDVLKFSVIKWGFYSLLISVCLLIAWNLYEKKRLEK